EQTREKLDRILASMAERGWDSFVIERRDDPRFAGIVGLAPQEVDGVEEIELGYRLMPPFWGQGLATEAACATRDYAFETLGLPRIISIIEPENVGSIRVAEKAGLRYERDAHKWERVVRIYAAAAPHSDTPT
nr:GNAT family N-acetyltransferase [Acidobacteriota bacterium]NIM61968.1 GNAT family N-acetyltransferase [Acidobacteriota bacterium]NIO59690.1 GNAT family N-acetyltransferase [Acidobacteriota bacterium]NIQ30785.1 GNAT family N-acetyltransferase [Acidobacteriota bacterium]NIQ85818.1 GNAT family N-acetyltransferase [Acidobacteriota bacterium]